MVLRRLLNTEMKVKSPADALTMPELFSGVTTSLWSEILTGPARNITASPVCADHLSPANSTYA